MLNFMLLYFFCTLGGSLLLFVLHRSLVWFPSYNTKVISANILLAAYTFSWYSISVTFTMFNKWFMTQWLGKSIIIFNHYIILYCPLCDLFVGLCGPRSTTS